MEFWSKVYTSIGFGHEENEYVDNTRKILLFSYYDLPCHLKTCLLYLSIYPEDHVIEKDSLIWKWVAEGFIHEEPGAGLFEIGERYFNELVNKSMIMPIEESYYPDMEMDVGIITWCRVHDMMLDMICLLSKEENFVTILDCNEQYTNSHCNARRLAVQDIARSLNAMCNAKMLPSLSCFEVLHILGLEGPYDSHNRNLLEHVGKLVHLRHLKLASMGNCELPKEIGHLKFLLVNIISKLPASICRLSQLKCLNICETDIEVPCWIGDLTSLEELCLRKVEDQSNFVTELGKLTELRKLHIGKSLSIDGDRGRNSWAESLAKLVKIQVINICSVHEHRFFCHGEKAWERCILHPQLRVLRMSYQEPGLVARINPRLLPDLSNLELLVYSPDLEVFGSFRELISLELDMCSALHHDTMGGAGAFPKLRVFKTDATLGSFQEGDMPALESLEFNAVAECNDVNISFGFDFASLGNLPLTSESLYMPLPWTTRRLRKP
uniref:NB-ARC domain-containing protein n=1 Tax=Aegilops tauschii subsp. strangulata TaxID=200361 RepID=A0A453QA81_AEGTS